MEQHAFFIKTRLGYLITQNLRGYVYNALEIILT